VSGIIADLVFCTSRSLPIELEEITYFITVLKIITDGYESIYRYVCFKLLVRNGEMCQTGFGFQTPNLVRN